MYYTRTYIRLQDVIANVWSFMDLIMLIIQIPYSYYLENEYTSYLQNRMFKFEVDDSNSDEINNININMKEIKEIDNLDNYGYIKRNTSNNSNLNNKINIKNQVHQACEATFTANLNNPAENIENIENNEIDSIRSNSKLHFNAKAKSENPDNDQININKHLNSLNKPRKKIIISSKDRCHLLVFNCCIKKPILDSYVLKKEFITIADKLIEDRTEIFELWKQLDQFNFVKKLLLNENQCFMLQNIGSKLIVHKFVSKMIDSLNECSELLDEKYKLKIKILKEYVKNKNVINDDNKDIKDIKSENKISFSDIDKLLWNSIDEEVRVQVEQ